MKKIIFLMPVYNDWEPLTKLLSEIDLIIKDINDYQFQCIIINDHSSVDFPEMTKPKNFDYIKIINMRENRGHARCIAAGIRYINQNEECDYTIIMDSDGEDRPIEIRELIKKIRLNPKNSVVAKRVKRSEGIMFQTLYHIHKLTTYIFTGKKINFGNYTCLTMKDIQMLSNKDSLWSSFSGTLKKYVLYYDEINSTRGMRYSGPSKMSLIKLIIHSFSIIAVFKNIVFLRSAFMIIILSLLVEYFGSIVITLQILIVIFNLLIFLISKRESQADLIKSHENILSEKTLH